MNLTAYKEKLGARLKQLSASFQEQLADAKIAADQKQWEDFQEVFTKKKEELEKKLTQLEDASEEKAAKLQANIEELVTKLEADVQDFLDKQGS